MDSEFMEGVQEALKLTKPGYKASMPNSRRRSFAVSAGSDFGSAPDPAVLQAKEKLSDFSGEAEDFEFFTGKTKSSQRTPSSDNETAARIVPIAPDSPAPDSQKPFAEGVVYDPKTKTITGWKG